MWETPKAVRWALWPATAIALLAVPLANAQTSPPAVLPAPGELPPTPGLVGPQIPAIPPPTVSTQTPAQPGAPEAPSYDSTAGRPRAWSYSMGLGAGWDENIDASIADGPSSWGGFLFASLSYLHSRPGGQIRLTAGGSGTAYRDFDVYNRPNGNASFDGNWRLSRSVDASLSAGYGYGHTDNSQWLTNQGLLYPLGAMQTYNGSARLSWRAARRTTLYADARGVRAAFDSKDLSVGDSVRTALGLYQEIGKRDGLGFESAWERAGEPESLFVSLRWRHTLSPRTGLILEGGASRTTGARPGELASGRNFFGGAGLSRQIGGKSLVNVAYRREVVPVFGIGGVRLVDRFSLAFSTTLGRSWFAGLGATYTLEPNFESDGSFSSGDGQANLGRHLGRYWGLSVAGRYRRNAAASAPLREAYRVGAYLSWEPTAR